jgi:hypothetical protein
MVAGLRNRKLICSNKFRIPATIRIDRNERRSQMRDGDQDGANGLL